MSEPRPPDDRTRGQQAFDQGVTLARDGRFAEATAVLQEALRLDPAHPQARAWLQWIHEQAAHPATARVLDQRPAVVPPNPSLTPYVPPTRASTSTALVIAWVVGLGCLAAGVLGLLISAPLMFVGRQAAQLEREFPTPVVLTYAEFIARRPERGWYRITGAALDLSEATWLELPGGYLISDIHIPVRGVEEDTDREPVRVLFTPQPGEVESTVREMARIRKDKGEDAAAEFVRNNIDRIWIERDVEGVIPSGLERMSSETAEIVRAYGERLAPEHFVLGDRKLKPGTGASLNRPAQVFLALSGGAFLLSLLTPFGYRLYVRRRQNAHA